VDPSEHEAHFKISEIVPKEPSSAASDPFEVFDKDEQAKMPAEFISPDRRERRMMIGKTPLFGGESLKKQNVQDQK